MKKNIYCGLQFYDDISIKKILNTSEIHGIVLGDLFCQKRMFDGGILQMYEMLSLVGRSEKQLVFQTMLYNTEKQFEETIQILKYLDRRFPGSIVSTVDLGILLWCQRECNTLKVIWNRYGRNRERYHNAYFFDLLKDLQVVGIEVDLVEDAAFAKEQGLDPFIIYEKDHYRSLGRVCYNRYQLEIKGQDCVHSCRNGMYEMRTKDGKNVMTLDGYILGQQWKKNPRFGQMVDGLDKANIMIYTKTVGEFEEQLKEIDL